MKIKIKKSQIILGGTALILAVCIALTAVQMVARYGDMIKSKKVIKHMQLEYADEDFNDYIDDIIEDTTEIIYEDSDENFDDSEDDEDSDEITDNFDWLDDGGKNNDKETYSSPIQLNGTAPAQKNVRNVNVSTQQTVFSDYYGLGGSLFPEILSDIPTSGWYNSVAWEFERQKAINNKPNITRLLIDMDAIITNTETNPNREDYENNSDYRNYMSGVYDFSNDSAESFWKVLDCFKDAGTEVIFNTGWKCDERIKTWYPDVSNDWANSAPYDIKAFVQANIAWLLEIQRRGYSARYIDFGNEVQWGGDFKTHEDATVYHTILIATMSKAMDYAKNNEVTYKYIENGVTKSAKAKLSMNTELLLADGAISSDNDGYYKWLSKLKTSVKKVLGDATPSATSGHVYYRTTAERTTDYSVVYNLLNKYRETLSDMFITEAYVSPAACDTDYYNSREHGEVIPGKWETSLTSYLIASANSGGKGINNWEYGTSFYPCVSSVKGSDYVDGAGSVFAGGNKASEYKVATNYRISSLLSNYVTAHSDVLMSKWEGEDIRVASFKLPDGNYTFVVEANKSSDLRNLKITLDNSVGKLYRYHFNDSVNADGTIKDSENRSLQGIMIQADKEFEPSAVINDTIDNDYGVYVYSTKAPVKQIKLDKAVVEIDKSETLEINAELLNCGGFSNVKWEITAASKNSGTSLKNKDLMNNAERKGSITSNGKKCTYTPGSTAKSGDAVAIRATLLDSNGNKTGTYSVAVVYIK